MKNILLNTYDGSFKVPTEWLKQNMDRSIPEFLNTYTWDESEWLSILYAADQRDAEVEQLTVKLKQGYSLFKKGDQEGILHACSKNKGYQFSYFDQHGAIGDIQEISLNDMTKKIYELGFVLCGKEDLQIIK